MQDFVINANLENSPLTCETLLENMAGSSQLYSNEKDGEMRFRRIGSEHWLRWC